MDAATLVLRAIVIGASAAGLVVMVRALPAVERLMERGVRPWACDVCSSLWSLALTTFASAALWGPWALVAAPPAYPLAYWLVRVLANPTGLPPPPEASWQLLREHDQREQEQREQKQRPPEVS